MPRDPTACRSFFFFCELQDWLRRCTRSWRCLRRRHFVNMPPDRTIAVHCKCAGLLDAGRAPLKAINARTCALLAATSKLSSSSSRACVCVFVRVCVCVQIRMYVYVVCTWVHECVQCDMVG
jgi:hypothetical protein